MASDSQRDEVRLPPEGAEYTDERVIGQGGAGLRLRSEIVACPHFPIVSGRLQRLRAGLFPIHGTIKGKRIWAHPTAWPYPRLCHLCSLAASCNEFLSSYYHHKQESDLSSVAEGRRSGWSVEQEEAQVWRNYRFVDSMENYWGQN